MAEIKEMPCSLIIPIKILFEFHSFSNKKLLLVFCLIVVSVSNEVLIRDSSTSIIPKNINFKNT